MGEDGVEVLGEKSKAAVTTPVGKKMKQARLPFAPINKQKSKYGIWIMC